ncbi:hypothetical protein BDK51DRAFT_32984 [Blyttiomyces helicus]|uniref:F-box domain-containing protein n=1 Tax=Blyttiomyces helicus TaxID=388810 RepID=A0A4P9VXL6_9FUNG|nr:hypothetical protein BDK51DRAFT_32984 [Blyttiomyces helicus]|eukprot:RKO84459.1 hypothetical protein BDK51DRAFT_32984 [Blyttiomyces helicus]
MTSNDAFASLLSTFPLIEMFEPSRAYRLLKLLAFQGVTGITEAALIRLLHIRGSTLTHLPLLKNDWVTDATVAALSYHAPSLEVLEISGCPCVCLATEGAYETSMIASATHLPLLCLGMGCRNLRIIDTGRRRKYLPDIVVKSLEAAGISVGVAVHQDHLEWA